MKHLIFSLSFMLFGSLLSMAQPEEQDPKLTGTVIGTLKSIDYNNPEAPSKRVNTRECAFDGDINTYFAAFDRSLAWVGLDLGEPHVITKIGWVPANRNRGDERILLGVFEGANSPDFMDALPLFIIQRKGVYYQMDYADITCSKGFRYVRYVGPNDERCNIAEIEFYGHAGEGDESNLYRLTNLPTVSIHTEDNVEPYDKIHDINAVITIISDKKLRTDSGTVRLRGNGSLTFPKKPYRIKYNEKHKVLGSPAKSKKWTLVNNYGDKTLMRNLLAFELSRCLEMPYTPFGESVDVLVNGEYKGNYQLCDHIDVKKNRVELIETYSEEPVDSQKTAFLIEVDARASTEPCWFMSNMGTPMTIHYPDDDEITPQQKAYIENCFNEMEEDWKTSLDLSTFLRHFIVGELSGNTDTYWSVYMYKHRENDTIYFGPVWDFDLAFENDIRTYPINDKKSYLYRSGGSVAGKMRLLVDNIVVSDTDAKAKLLEIWGNARENKLNEDYLLNVIDTYEDYLQESQKLNFMRWPIMDELVHQNPVVWGSYEAEVQNVRRYISERLLWMDNKLEYSYNPTGIADLDFDESKSHQVYSMSGMPISGDLQNLPQGFYIVKQGRHIRKIQVR